MLSPLVYKTFLYYPFKQGKKESPISEDPFMPIISEPNLNSNQNPTT
jgi:hypothetical protein